MSVVIWCLYCFYLYPLSYKLWMWLNLAIEALDERCHSGVFVVTLSKFDILGIISKFRYLILSEFKQIKKLLFPIKSSESHQISGGIEVNWFAKICLILSMTFGDGPLVPLFLLWVYLFLQCYFLYYVVV